MFFRELASSLFLLYLICLYTECKMFSKTFTYSNSSLPVGCMESYPYGFNGKEKNDEVSGSGNNYDFGARTYDPRLGRWFSIDPLQSKHASTSPYCFVENSPIGSIDPDGKDVYPIISYTKDGKTGHAQIAVDNYVTVMKDTYDSQGNVTGQTAVQVADGSVTVYDLHAKADFNLVRMLKAGKSEPGIVKSYKADKDYVLDQNRQKNNGVVRIILEPGLTNQIQQGLEEAKKDYETGKKQYNATTNNCVDFVTEFVKQISGFQGINPSEKMQPMENAAQFLQGIKAMPKAVSTPNFLDKELKKVVNCDNSCGEVLNEGQPTGAFLNTITHDKVHDAKPSE